ncbi:type VII secretion integral membrane protein EccD [Stackebrandtia albiflava]|uniref:Type VII secretion integral membrane protein EccD n=1 Tax=Stackebrandtia albiflava TaxID=406432 RepID=A0A562V3S8_9ACTN|nr:type VII secretion integral membrane protein EccD [Stackebrandtia albiflava]TWJ12488.1 type VII secretion integral membrane protein EccD [Stackebrandtia albiflava]
MSVTDRLCRVTVVAPNTRMDVALPDHVRLCELQSDLLQHAADGPGGEDVVEDGASNGGWVLTRLGGAPLDPNLTPAQHHIMDGEELYFSPVAQVGPEAVFDDVIDAMATASGDRGGKWQTATSQVFGTVVGTVLLLGAAAAILFTGTEAAMWTGYGIAAALLAASVVFARALGRIGEATVVGLLSVVYGWVGGALSLGELPAMADLNAPRLMVAGAAAAVFAVVAGIGIPISAPVFSSAALAAAGLTGAAALCTFVGATPAESGAVVSTVFVGLIPAMPMLSFRVARLPMPTIPRSPQQLRSDTLKVDSELALRRSERADQHLTGMLAAAAIVTAGSLVFLAMAPSWPTVLMTILLTLLVLMRARIFLTVRQRMPFLLAGVVGIASLATSMWVHADPADRFLYVVAVLVGLAVIALSFVLGIAGKRVSPIWARMVDIVEVILFITIVPLTLWVWNAYWWVRTVNG